MQRLAVLRPEPGNSATVARATAAGFPTFALPLFAVQPLAWDVPDATAFDALILTSANAVRFAGDGLAALTGLPVLAVGAHTAAAARAAGFDVMAVGSGDGAEIAALAVAHGVSRALHLTGRDRTLTAEGPISAVIPVYESAELAVDPAALPQLSGSVALLHSARAARRLAMLIDAAGIDRGDIALAAFSPAIAASAGTGWAAIASATAPDDAALFAAVRTLAVAPHAADVDPSRRGPDKVGMDDPAQPAPGIVPAPAPVQGGASNLDAVAVPPLPPRVFPPSAPAPPPLPGASGMGWRMGVALGLIAFLVGVGVAAFGLSKFGRSTDGKGIATVTLPVGANGQTPVVIVPSKTDAPVSTIDLAALSNREAELAARIGDLEKRTVTVDRDAQRAASYATRSEGLMVAFAARRALDRGLNLGFLEEQLRDRFGATQPAAVATIAQAARDPVTLEDLRAGLDALAPELVTGMTSRGWWQSLQTEVANLVVLRKAGTPSSLPVDRLARARRLLEAGQVEAALAEVSRTPGAAQAGNWTGAARRYIGARRALDLIESAAILSPGADVAPPPITAP